MPTTVTHAVEMAPRVMSTDAPQTMTFAAEPITTSPQPMVATYTYLDYSKASFVAPQVQVVGQEVVGGSLAAMPELASANEEKISKKKKKVSKKEKGCC